MLLHLIKYETTLLKLNWFSRQDGNITPLVHKAIVQVAGDTSSNLLRQEKNSAWPNLHSKPLNP